MTRPLMQLPPGKPCKGCAGIPGTDAANTPETVATLQECIKTGEPFFCHESSAVRAKDGWWKDRHGNRYDQLPENHYRACRFWQNAVRKDWQPT